MASGETGRNERNNAPEEERGNHKREKERGESSDPEHQTVTGTIFKLVILKPIQEQEEQKKIAATAYVAWKKQKAESLEVKAREKHDKMRKEQRALKEKDERKQSANQVPRQRHSLFITGDVVLISFKCSRYTKSGNLSMIKNSKKS